ncbi:MAG TPA: hypothetical protein VII72_00695 [Myxococcota bacterium]|jgi:hypothetical protein
MRLGRLVPLAGNALLVTASLVASLAAGEVALRILHPSARQPFLVGQFLESERGKFCAYDPQLGWMGKPGIDAPFHYLDCQHRVRQNRHGFRGAEYGFERSDEPRIVVLGDSFVWGFGVEDDQIFTSVLERESDPPIEVVNLGVSGYGTDQELLLWRSLGRRFRPDGVLLVVCPYTDLWENLSPVAYGYPKPIFHFTKHGHRIGNYPVPESQPGAWQPGRTGSEAAAAELAQRPLLARLATHSALVSSAIVALARFEGPRRLLERRRIIPARDHAISWEPLAHLEPPPAEAAARWDTLFRLIDLLQQDVQASGAALEILIVPSVIQVYPDLWEKFVRENPQPEGARWNRDAPNQRIAAYAREKGIPVIDPLPTLREAARTDLFLYYGWNSHWTAAGHRLVAGELLRDMALRHGGPR